MIETVPRNVDTNWDIIAVITVPDTAVKICSLILENVGCPFKRSRPQLTTHDMIVAKIQLVKTG